MSIGNRTARCWRHYICVSDVMKRRWLRSNAAVKSRATAVGGCWHYRQQHIEARPWRKLLCASSLTFHQASCSIIAHFVHHGKWVKHNDNKAPRRADCIYEERWYFPSTSCGGAPSCRRSFESYWNDSIIAAQILTMVFAQALRIIAREGLRGIAFGVAREEREAHS